MRYAVIGLSSAEWRMIEAQLRNTADDSGAAEQIASTLAPLEGKFERIPMGLTPAQAGSVVAAAVQSGELQAVRVEVGR